MKAHHVIESIRRLSGNGIKEHHADMLEHCVSKSIKFKFYYVSLPDMSLKLMNEFIDKIRLPFPLCYFEIEGVGAMVARELDGDEYILFHPFYFNLSEAKSISTFDPELSFVICKDSKKISTLSNDQNVLRDLESIFNDETSFSIVSGILEMVVCGLSVMNCSNVECVENKPPEALNKKRNKSGKIPLFSYWTLHLSTKNKRYSKYEDDQQSTRIGPRLHLRRGHIRRLQSGTTTWVNSCMVGDQSRGTVAKDYHLHA